MQGMGARRLALTLRNRDGSVRTMTWAGPEAADGKGEGNVLRLSVPIRDRRAGLFIHAEIDIGVDGSIEAAARQASLFARLVEEHGLASLGHDPEPEPRTPQPACN